MAAGVGGSGTKGLWRLELEEAWLRDQAGVWVVNRLFVLHPMSLRPYLSGLASLSFNFSANGRS